MRELMLNAVWAAGMRLRSHMLRYPLLALLDPLFLLAGARLLPPPRTEVLVPLAAGMTMAVPPGFPSARSYASGAYEAEVAAVFARIVRPGMTVVDLGANVGYYTLLASALVGEQGRVYAFEPDPRAYRCLLRNVEANGCANVIPLEMAVSDKAGRSRFLVDPLGARGRLSRWGGGAGSVEVQTTTLDAFFAGRADGRIDVIKMDIEGGEAAALLGMREVSRGNPFMQLIMEFNQEHLRRAGVGRAQVMAALSALGFREGFCIERRGRPFSVSSGFPGGRGTLNLLLSRQPQPCEHRITEALAAPSAPAKEAHGG